MPNPNDLEEIPIEGLAKADDSDWEEVPLKSKAELEIDSQPKSLLEDAARSGLSAVGKASRALDSVTGAPIRAAVGAFQEGGNPMQAAGEQFRSLDPSKAPTGKDIAMKAGISGENTIQSPITLNPWDSEANKMSPAGIVGAGVETALDPTTYIPGFAVGKTAEKGAQVLGKLAPPVGRYLEKKAADRALKAAIGQNIKAFRKISGVTTEGAMDTEKALANRRAAGQMLLNKDENGKSALGWFSRPEDLAEKIGSKTEAVGEQIGKLGEAIDERYPEGAIPADTISSKIRGFASTIPETENGKALKERMLKEAANIEKMGPLTFEKAQKLKNQFAFNYTAPDALISNKDATNAIRRMIKEQMDSSLESFSKNPTRLSEDAQQQMAKYPDLKSQYGMSKQLTQAANDRALKNLSNRFMSPSDYGTGATAAVASAASGNPAGALKNALLMSGANKFARERGSAFAAKTLDLMANVAKSAPEALGKYGKALNAAALQGGAKLNLLHHLLLNNDPGYVEVMKELERKSQED